MSERASTPLAVQRVEPGLLIALMLSVAVVGASLFALSPLLPDIAADLGVSVAQAGRLPGTYSFALAVAAPAIGLSGRAWPRARILEGALLVFGIAWLLPLVMRSYDSMLVVTLLAGAAAGAALPAAYSLAGDLSTPVDRARILGRVVSGWPVAMLCAAPLIAVTAQASDWRIALAALGVASLIVWALLKAGLLRHGAIVPQGLPETAAPDLWTSVMTVAGHRPTRRLLIANLLDMGAFFAVYAFLGSQLRAANGWGASLAGLTLACYGVGLAVATLNARLIDRYGGLRSARAALLALVVVLGVLPWLTDRPLLIALAMVVWGAVQGSFFTAATALATDQLPALRGVVTALLSGSTYLGVALFAPLAGFLFAAQGLWAVGLVSGAACLLAAGLLRRL